MLRSVEVEDLFNLDLDFIYNRTTTASFYIDYEDNPDNDSNASIYPFGQGKERTWAPYVVIVLAVTREVATSTGP